MSITNAFITQPLGHRRRSRWPAGTRVLAMTSLVDSNFLDVFTPDDRVFVVGPDVIELIPCGELAFLAGFTGQLPRFTDKEY